MTCEHKWDGKRISTDHHIGRGGDGCPDCEKSSTCSICGMSKTYHDHKLLAESVEKGQPITDEIKDGRLLLLEVENGEHPTQDAARFITIGFNTLADTGEDHWHIAGWCWCQDHFTETNGTPVKWWPLPPQGKDNA